MKATNGLNYIRMSWVERGKFVALIKVQKPHKYSKHTSYGERWGWKFLHWIHIESSFETRQAAVTAMNEKLQNMGIKFKTKTSAPRLNPLQVQALRSMLEYGPQEIGTQLNGQTAAALVKRGLAEKRHNSEMCHGDKREHYGQYGLTEAGEELARKLVQLTQEA